MNIKNLKETLNIKKNLSHIKGLGSVLKKEKELILALEIGTDWIKAAVSETDSKGYKLVGLLSKKVQNKGSDAITAAIKELLLELKLSEFKLVFSLPRHSTTIRYLQLPSVNPAEIEDMVKLQAIKQLPYSKEELTVGHKILEESKKGYAKVMLVAVHRKILDKYLGMLKNAGLEPALIALSSEATHAYFGLTDTKTHGDKNETVLLVDIDSFFTEIQIQRDNKLLFSRSLHYGMQHLKGSKKRHDWIEEIKLSLNTYARDYDSSSISKVVMGGVAWKLEDIEQTISKALGLNVTIITPLQNISITQKAKIDFGRLDHPLSFSSVIALALSYQQLKINLLPFSVQTTLKKKAEYKNLINTTILIGCIILIFSVLIAKKLHDKKVILKTLNQKLSAIAPEAEDLDKKAKMTRVVIQQLEAEGSCLDIIREVHSITPSKIYLTKFIFTDGKGIVLKGSSPNMSQIFKYITIVEGSGYFANAQLRYASKRKTKGADLTDFEIHALLEQE